MWDPTPELFDTVALVAGVLGRMVASHRYRPEE